MTIDVNFINSYAYSIDTANLSDNVKLVLNNAAQKSADTQNSIFEQNAQSTNSTLLSEYTLMIAKSNVAQQLVLDSNLKETLKFLNSEAAKKVSKSLKKKTSDIIEEILADNDILGYDTNEEMKEASDFDSLDHFDIEIDHGKDNIFAA